MTRTSSTKQNLSLSYHSLSSQFLKRSKSSEISYDMTEIHNNSNWAHTWFRNIVLSHGNGDLINEGGSESIYSSDSHPIGNDSKFSAKNVLVSFNPLLLSIIL